METSRDNTQSSRKQQNLAGISQGYKAKRVGLLQRKAQKVRKKRHHGKTKGISRERRGVRRKSGKKRIFQAKSISKQCWKPGERRRSGGDANGPGHKKEKSTKAQGLKKRARQTTVYWTTLGSRGIEMRERERGKQNTHDNILYGKPLGELSTNSELI